MRPLSVQGQEGPRLQVSTSVSATVPRSPSEPTKLKVTAPTARGLLLAASDESAEWSVTSDIEIGQVAFMAHVKGLGSLRKWSRLRALIALALRFTVVRQSRLADIIRQRGTHHSWA